MFCRCTVVHGTPTMFVDLTNAIERSGETVSAEIAVSGGATFPPALADRMVRTLGIKSIKVRRTN